MRLSRNARLAKALHVLPFVKPEILHSQFDRAQISLQNFTRNFRQTAMPFSEGTRPTRNYWDPRKALLGIGRMKRLEEAAVAKTVAKEASSQAGGIRGGQKL